MCGMAGIINLKGRALTMTECEFFQNLLYLNYFRGIHSTGVLRGSVSTKKGSASIFKFAKSVAELEGDGTLDNILGKMNGTFPSFLMGHTRQATIGSVNRDNTHPFKSKDFVFFHNGTIQGDFEGTYKYDTDSEAFLHLLQTHWDQFKGEEGHRHHDTFLNTLNDIYKDKRVKNVAYALQVYNRTNGNIVFVRNNERPLWFTHIDHETLVWASDTLMLDLAFKYSYKTPKDTYQTHNKTFLKDRIELSKCGKYFQPVPFEVMRVERGKGDIYWINLGRYLEKEPVTTVSRAQRNYYMGLPGGGTSQNPGKKSKKQGNNKSSTQTNNTNNGGNNNKSNKKSKNSNTSDSTKRIAPDYRYDKHGIYLSNKDVRRILKGKCCKECNRIFTLRDFREGEVTILDKDAREISCGNCEPKDSSLLDRIKNFKINKTLNDNNTVH